MRRLIYLFLLGRETPIFDLLVERPEELKVVKDVRDDLNWKASLWFQKTLSCWMAEDEKEARRADLRTTRFLKLEEKLQELYQQVEIALGIPQDESIPF